MHHGWWWVMMHNGEHRESTFSNWNSHFVRLFFLNICINLCVQRAHHVNTVQPLQFAAKMYSDAHLMSVYRLIKLFMKYQTRLKKQVSPVHQHQIYILLLHFSICILYVCLHMAGNTFLLNLFSHTIRHDEKNNNSKHGCTNAKQWRVPTLPSCHRCIQRWKTGPKKQRVTWAWERGGRGDGC